MRRSSYYNSDTKAGSFLVSILVVVGIMLFYMVGLNSCTASEWNNGRCSECQTRYELSAVYNDIKYYSCPDCGNEVCRYLID